MSFNEYYQEELAYLREMGEEFARTNPKLAPFLARKGNDPDIERLLEGFAFIAGRIRQKLDDEIPEFTQALISLIWPNLLRPLPSASILQFLPAKNAITERKKIERGELVSSVEVEGTLCQFRTCYDVDLYPMDLAVVDYHKSGTKAFLNIGLIVHPSSNIRQGKMQKLRFFINGEPHISQAVYLWIFKYLKNVQVKIKNTQGETADKTLEPGSVKPVGFAEDQHMLPYEKNSFAGYRLLQEYFTLPQKFYFFDIDDLEKINYANMATEVNLTFEFVRPMEDNVRLEIKNFLLYCTPIINLFQVDSEAIQIQMGKIDYDILPATKNPFHHEIYAMEKVQGSVRGESGLRTYRPFLSYAYNFQSPETQEVFYKTKVNNSVAGRGLDTQISFVDISDKSVIPDAETISIELLCTNRHLAEKLRIGDIQIPTGSMPEIGGCTSLLPPTVSIAPPIGKDLHWFLISNLSLNYNSLMSIDALRLMLATYNFYAFNDKQAQRVNEQRMQGLESLTVVPSTVVYRGTPIRGLKTRLDMRSSKFGGEGEMFLFAAILNEFFAQYVSVNSFNQLTVKDLDRGEEYQWKPYLSAQQPIS